MTIVREMTDADHAALIGLWRASWMATYRQSLGEDALAAMLADLEQQGVAGMLPGTGEKGYCSIINKQLQGSIIIAERGRIAYVWGALCSARSAASRNWVRTAKGGRWRH